jgi:protein TonB
VISTSSQLPNNNLSKPSVERLQTIELPSSDADYLHNPPPIYPRMSKRLGEQGTVVLRVLISVNGQAEKIEIFKSSGFDRLDQAAIETAVKWRYKPGQRMGQAESMWFNLPIRFELN